jgi:trimeric autotransporter adhesin
MSSRAGWVALAAAALTPVLALSAAPPALAASPDGVIASGSDWSVTTSPGGYVITYRLDEPLPIVSDAPTIVVDGVPLGLATESADGLSLSLTTTDTRVLSAHDVEKGWSSGDEEKAAETTGPVEESVDPSNETLLRQLRSVTPFALPTEDPSTLGAYAVTEAEYDFGDRAVPLAAIGGIRGEMTGKMYLTDAPGARPTVILLHGRHTSCANGTANPLRWPCGATQANVRSYLGYEGTGRALASRGYNVLSIAANAVNSNDNQLALDYGAQARGQLILDTLGMLQKATAGQPVSFDDVPQSGSAPATTRTLDDALLLATTRADQPAAPAGVTAASLQGRFDLTRVGIMGHSRGGEGVVSAATLNQALEHPYGIVSVLPLAPVDFGRMTLPDVPTGVFLPYCDGDVANQQGQHFIDDSRHAFGDDVLRSAVWIMGANHNFFNTVWTPGLYPYSTSDDWRDATGATIRSTCHTSDPTRLTAAQQYQVGVSYMTGFFRLTMGGETQFQALFDGSVKPTTPSTGYADVRVMASQPTSATTLVTDFTTTDSLVRTTGNATATVCTNLTGRTVPQSMPFCAVTKASAQVPHWTPGSFAPNVPAFPVTRVLWTGSTSNPSAPSTGELRVSVPAGKRDVSRQAQLTVKTAPDESVPTGTDFTITVLDGRGGSYSVLASAVDPLAVNRMPGGDPTRLDKVVLQQLTIPTAQITGVDLTDVREVRFTAAVGADGTGAGGIYLSDLAFDTPTVGTAVVQTRTAMNVAPTVVEEGSGPGTADVAVYLNRADSATIEGYVSVIGAASGAVGIAMQKVTFAPGETCKAVTVPTLGNTAASSAASSSFKVSATNTSGAVMGANAFTQLVVREDDGVTGQQATPLPPVGAQGDVCAELAASRTPVPLATSAADIAPGGSVTLTGDGYRAGEAVAFTFGDDAQQVVADADGTAVATFDAATDSELGMRAASALGAGSARIATADVGVLAPTEISLGVDGATVAGAPITFVAKVTGDETDGTVVFTDGPTIPGGTGRSARSALAGGVLGTATVVDGVATLRLDEGLTEGAHSIVATFGRTDRASASSSEAITLTVVAAAAVTDPAGNGSGASPSGALAVTGMDATIWVLVAAAAVALGTAGVVIVRRRRRA